MTSNWHSNWYPASGPLAQVAAGVWSVHSASDAELAARVLPDGSTSVVFRSDGAVLRSSDEGWRPLDAMSVSGPRSSPFEFQLSPGGRMLIVQLQPAGAMQILGVPMSSLANAFDDLAAVAGPESHRLGDFVLDERDDQRSVRAIESWLMDRVRQHRPICERTAAVVREVTCRAGNIRVEDLAERVNLSRRHLGRMMMDRVGASPKLFARVARFDHAVQRARRCPDEPWAEIALDSGYADQAHLTREFVDLGGIRPSQLRGAAASTIW
jgi:AraC-like DNA-binding protein